MFWFLLTMLGLSIGQCGNATAVCGWDQLFNGNIVTASFIMFDEAFLGFTIVILFILYQVMLFLKTRNMTMGVITGLIFISMFVGANVVSASGFAVIKPIVVPWLWAILVLEFGILIYAWLWK